MASSKQTKTATAPKPATSDVDWQNMGVDGFERTKTEDFGIPFIIIVQDGSPEVKKSHPAYATKKIEGAEPGSIINTQSRQVLNPDGAPVIFVPCSYERMYVEWKPRDEGGGFVRQHISDAILSQCKRSEEDNRDYLPNGNLIVTTAYFFGLLIDDDGNGSQCVISMTSTQLKKARMWLNMAMSIKFDGPNGKFTPPLFSHKYALTTVAESNNDGSWMGWHIETAGPMSNKALIENAKEVAKKMSAGNRPQISAAKTDDVPM